MEYIVFFTLLIGGAYFCTRYLLLKSAIRRANCELLEIQKQIEENRIVKMGVPDPDLESFLQTINQALAGIRKERLSYAGREKEFQMQIENISHDLRTPLTAILGYLKVLDFEKMSEEDIESLEIVRRKAKLLERLIAQFYELSRLTAKDCRLERERLDGGRILREMLLDSYLSFEEKKLDVQMDIPEHEIWVYGDLDALQRIFANVIQNAVRYAKSCLSVSVFQEKQTVFMLENDIEGMEQQDVTHLFDRFYRKDASRNQSSTGLGLTITRLLTEEMDGEITAKLIEKGDKKYLRIEIALQNE